MDYEVFEVTFVNPTDRRTETGLTQPVTDRRKSD